MNFSKRGVHFVEVTNSGLVGKKLMAFRDTDPPFPSPKKARLSRSSLEVDKTPPHSLEAEQAFLGSILLSNEQWDRTSGLLVCSDFYFPVHRVIFKEMDSLFNQQKPMDLVTLSQSLESKKSLEAVGGFAYLAEISSNTPSASNITAYARIIREQAVLRALIQVAQEVAELGFSPEGRSCEALLDLAESKVFEIANQRSARDQGPQSIETLLEQTVEQLEKLYKDPTHSGITGLASGFTDLDAKTAGFQAADLIILASRPSMGKTTLALNLCEHAILSQAKPVLIFSLEMPASQLILRILASLSRIDQTRLRTGRLTDDDWARFSSSHSLLLHRKNLFVDDTSQLTISELRSRSRRIYRDNGGLSLLMVDYLQLMRPSAGIESRALEIAEISRNLKGLAKELKIPILALSQLNRGLEQRADKRPLPSDLRESGSIEQDADLVLFIYRDEVYDENTEEKGVAELILGKHRNGPIGTVKLTFQKNFARFENHTAVEFESMSHF